MKQGGGKFKCSRTRWAIQTLAKIRIFLNLGSYCVRELNARVKGGMQEVLGVCGMGVGGGEDR